jgi:hypothetical protein
MSVQTQAAVTQMKHFAFLLRSLNNDIPPITGNIVAKAEVGALAASTTPVPGSGMETNITKAEFQACMKTIEDLAAFLTAARLDTLNAMLKGL